MQLQQMRAGKELTTSLKCYYHRFNKSKYSWIQTIISQHPLIVLDMDFNGNIMGVEYIEM